ncbi:MAG: cache domain-containing protein, partial [Pseudomonadota bacterium]
MVIGTAIPIQQSPGSSIATRLIAILTLCAVLIIGIGMFIDFRLSRATLLEGLQRESDETIRSVIVDMEQWLESVKSSTLLLGRVIQQREYSEPGLQQILRDSVEVNPDIFGATIALAAGQSSSTLGFAPYYFRSGNGLQYSNLAGSDNNYQEQPWFQEVQAAGKPIWVEPYYDRAGARVLMTTF